MSAAARTLKITQELSRLRRRSRADFATDRFGFPSGRTAERTLLRREQSGAAAKVVLYPLQTLLRFLLIKSAALSVSCCTTTLSHSAHLHDAPVKEIEISPPISAAGDESIGTEDPPRTLVIWRTIDEGIRPLYSIHSLNIKAILPMLVFTVDDVLQKLWCIYVSSSVDKARFMAVFRGTGP